MVVPMSFEEKLLVVIEEFGWLRGHREWLRSLDSARIYHEFEWLVR